MWNENVTSAASFFLESVWSLEGLGEAVRGVAAGTCWQNKPSISDQSRSTIGEPWWFLATTAQMLCFPTTYRYRKIWYRALRNYVYKTFFFQTSLILYKGNYNRWKVKWTSKIYFTLHWLNKTGLWYNHSSHLHISYSFTVSPFVKFYIPCHNILVLSCYY